MTTNPPLDKELRNRREALSLNKTELASRLGTTAVAVSAWERGDRQPNDEHAAVLVELFGESDSSR